MKKLLSANEAVAHGVLHSSVRVAAAYPGTPSTEILETVAKLRAAASFEWSVNEKVAFEVACGAAMAGGRAIAAMKQVGLNVAMDPLMTIAYVGVTGGLVLVSADDPGMHSSQNEQDNRVLARFARCPTFEPADSQEAYDMTRAAFDLSEKFRVPVILRLTTRTSHTSGVVELPDEPPPARDLLPYVKDARARVSVPANAKLMREAAERRTAALAAESEASAFNFALDGVGGTAFVASGVAWQYVREVFPRCPAFKVGFSWPLPVEKLRAFAKGKTRLVVVEENDPVIADGMRAAGIDVYREQTPLRTGELNPARLRALSAELFATPAPVAAAPAAVPPRPPVLCAGCSHRGVFHVLRKLGATVCGDIGCYTLGAAPPLSALDTTICMGASIGNAMGMRKAGLGSKRIAAVLGDSTFFHSGMTGLLDLAYNGGKVTVVVLDNRITAMTGHQDNPGTGRTLMGEPAKEADIAGIARAVGIGKVFEVDAYDLKEMEALLKDCLDGDEPAVVVAKGPCVVNAKLVGKSVRKTDETKCVSCGACFRLGCPAIVRKARAGEPVNGRDWAAGVDASLCSGCTLCEQVCPKKAFSAAE
ncbi:MAG: 4Fe-4S binding protein [Kiritimatiellae bacterium]|nr:4Fe-4S binding protein [Kiritimatiellia bacterium]